jgi:hypothetical protein
MNTSRKSRLVSSRRGFAVIAAIGVLVVLTILTMAFSASHFQAMHNCNGSHQRGSAYALARAGVDTATALLRKSPDKILGRNVVYTAKGGEYRISAVQPKPEDAVYAGGFLKPRPGDAVVAVGVKIAGLSGYSYCLDRKYLVNANAAGARRLMLSSSIVDVKR